LQRCHIAVDTGRGTLKMTEKEIGGKSGQYSVTETEARVFYEHESHQKY
jgi:hypothetical protein